MLSILDIFEKVNLTTPLEQRRFFNYFYDSVNELRAMYGDDFVFGKGVEGFTLPKDLSDENAVLPLYYDSIVDNIIFLATNEEAYKSEFLRKARNDFLKYWNDNAKGRRIRRMRW